MQAKTLFISCLLSLTSVLAFLSCVENDRALGGDLLSEESLLTVGVKTFDIPVSNRISDSLQAGNTVTMLVGSMSDPVFGTAVSNAATYVLPYSDSTDFGDNPRLTSAYMVLSVDSISYIDNDRKGMHQRIHIYRLTSPLDSTIGLCNSLTSDDYSTEPVTVSDPVIYGEGEIRIDLTESFAQELLSITPEEFEDVELFLDKIPGLYIELEPPIGHDGGGRMNYLNLDKSVIYVNYILNDPDRGFTDLDTTESFAFGYSSAFNYFSTGSDGLADENPGDTLYLEGLSGVKPHIKASVLKDMIDNWITEDALEDYTVIVSRAELKFPYEMPADYERFNREFPSFIYAFTRDPYAGGTDSYYMPLDDIYTVNNRGEMNRALREYSLDITSYVQKLITSGKEDMNESLDLWIAPLTYRTNQADEVRYEIDNYNYSRAILNGPSADRKPTLTVTYGLMEK